MNTIPIHNHLIINFQSAKKITELLSFGYPSNVGNIDDKKDVSILNFTTTLEK